MALGRSCGLGEALVQLLLASQCRAARVIDGIGDEIAQIPVTWPSGSNLTWYRTSVKDCRGVWATDAGIVDETPSFKVSKEKYTFDPDKTGGCAGLNFVD